MRFLREQFLNSDKVIFYLFDCINKLKYYFNRTVLKYRLFTGYLNHHKKCFTFFGFSYIKETNVKLNNKGKKKKF